jgi:hypothetical protein
MGKAIDLFGWATAGAHPGIFLGAADPEAMYNLCLILKITL